MKKIAFIHEWVDEVGNEKSNTQGERTVAGCFSEAFNTIEGVEYYEVACTLWLEKYYTRQGETTREEILEKVKDYDHIFYTSETVKLLKDIFENDEKLFNNSYLFSVWACMKGYKPGKDFQNLFETNLFIQPKNIVTSYDINWGGYFNVKNRFLGFFIPEQKVNEKKENWIMIGTKHVDQFPENFNEYLDYLISKDYLVFTTVKKLYEEDLKNRIGEECFSKIINLRVIERSNYLSIINMCKGFLYWDKPDYSYAALEASSVTKVYHMQGNHPVLENYKTSYTFENFEDFKLVFGNNLDTVHECNGKVKNYNIASYTNRIKNLLKLHD